MFGEDEVDTAGLHEAIRDVSVLWTDTRQEDPSHVVILEGRPHESSIAEGRLTAWRWKRTAAARRRRFACGLLRVRSMTSAPLHATQRIEGRDPTA